VGRGPHRTHPSFSQKVVEAESPRDDVTGPHSIMMRQASAHSNPNPTPRQNAKPVGRATQPVFPPS